jgi:hypothetical protein
VYRLINISSSILIYRPLNRVFDFISSAANDFEWQYGTLASGQLSEGARRVGASFRSIGHLMGRRVQGTFEITEYEANHRYGFKSLSGPLHMHTLYSLELADGSTRVNVATDASPANVLQVSEPMMKKYMQKQLREDLAMLKSILEAR